MYSIKKEKNSANFFVFIFFKNYHFDLEHIPFLIVQ